MAVLTWILLIVLIVAAGAFIARPLRRRGSVVVRDDERTQALAAKEAALQLIRDLEQDRQTGKLEEEEFAEQRATAEAEAIRALKRLDGQGAPAGGDDLELMIGAEKARIKKETGA